MLGHFLMPSLLVRDALDQTNAKLKPKCSQLDECIYDSRLKLADSHKQRKQYDVSLLDDLTKY
ncbi:unnamed protein product [Schistosoma mattheei]|uniref:Uncharacterized protein n=1 Tax=Schistosoma mattheei TaxID=31246 RepID=A0A3P8GT52_9TREM|nr:unnamed protein product [Schistosoma mattheei]